MWADWDPSFDAESNEPEPTNGSNGDAPAAKRENNYKDIVVTEIDPDNGKLSVQIIGTGTAALATMMNAFKSFHLNPSNNNSLPGPPKTGEYVAAKFSADGQWYRARIRGNDRAAKESDIVFIDYGNSEKVPWSKLRPLSQAEFSTQKLKPQAVNAVLSFLQFPPNKDYLNDAIHFIGEVTAEKQLVANVDYTDAKDGTLYVTLMDPKLSTTTYDTINAEIISEGHAMVSDLHPVDSKNLRQLHHHESLIVLTTITGTNQTQALGACLQRCP